MSAKKKTLWPNRPTLSQLLNPSTACGNDRHKLTAGYCSVRNYWRALVALTIFLILALLIVTPMMYFPADPNQPKVLGIKLPVFIPLVAHVPSAITSAFLYARTMQIAFTTLNP